MELLAPAGGLDAGYAALQYGADAVYLGLAKFSARADAENFGPTQLSELTAYAHALSPRRRVYVALNTLVLERELDEVVDCLEAVSEAAADALIVQDLGVARMARRHFPELRLHASTQLAIHDRRGVEAARELGFARATLARELTLAEIAEASAAPGIETEAFVHGALCYAYSGLCLFSSQALGRSGNRGRCAYLCRDRFTPAGDAPGASGGFVFSMKDLALPEAVAALRRAGVAALKIEGRKKSPLYVAATTHFYRQLLDGTLGAQEARELADEIRTIFSRPWTPLFVFSRWNREVVDREWVGHRGAPLGRVEALAHTRGGEGRLRFRTGRDLELHDGLQVDVPGLPRPYGFAVTRFRILDRPGSRGGKDAGCRYRAPSGARLEVDLPPDHPAIPRGAAVYCASSQAIKRRFRLVRPRPGQFRVRPETDFKVELAPQRLRVTASLTRRNQPGVVATVSLDGDFPATDKPERMAQCFQETFGKLGATPFAAGAVTVVNPQGRFVPLSRLNPLRRRLLEALERQWQEAIGNRLQPVKRAIAWPVNPAPHGADRPPPVRWSLKTDRWGALDLFEPGDWDGVDEVILQLGPEPGGGLAEGLRTLAARVGRERLRLALPPIARAWEGRALEDRVASLVGAGWTRWQIANLSGWMWLNQAPKFTGGALNISADWPLYVLNREAARQLLDLGADSLTLSPEDGLDNWRSLLAGLGARAVVPVYQDTPLFISETCAGARPGCGEAGQPCPESLELKSSFGDRVLAINRRCRTVVINRRPFCLAARLPELRQAGAVRLRADFLFRTYGAEEVRDLWRNLRAGRPIPGTQVANFDRGLE